MKNKKAVMGQIISLFVLVLIISILAGLTFLFTAEIKGQVEDQLDYTTVSRVRESVTANTTGHMVSNASSGAFKMFSMTSVTLYNATKTFASPNYTFTSAGIISNLTPCDVGEECGWECGYLWLANYTFQYTEDNAAYMAVNDTEAAGATIVNYLPLVFLALIFGVILTVVLKIILPYINLGQQMGAGF